MLIASQRSGVGVSIPPPLCEEAPRERGFFVGGALGSAGQGSNRVPFCRAVERWLSRQLTHSTCLHLLAGTWSIRGARRPGVPYAAAIRRMRSRTTSHVVGTFAARDIPLPSRTAWSPGRPACPMAGRSSGRRLAPAAGGREGASSVWRGRPGGGRMMGGSSAT